MDLRESILAAGALGFGVLGLVAPERLARMAGTDAATARALGGRDLANGVAIVLAPSVGIPQRIAFDLEDTLLFGRRKPSVAVAALSFAALGAFTLATRSSRSRS